MAYLARSIPHFTPAIGCEPEERQWPFIDSSTYSLIKPTHMISSSSDPDNCDNAAKARKAGYLLIAAGVMVFAAMLADGVTDEFDSTSLLALSSALLSVGLGVYNVLRSRSKRVDGSDAVTADDVA